MPKPSRKGISAEKRLRQSIKRRDRNRSVKSRTRTILSKAIAAIANDAGSAEEAVREAVGALDRAAQKGVIHANAAARSKSRLLKRFNLAVASAVAAAASAAPPRRRAAAAPPPPEVVETPPPAPRRRGILSRRPAEEKPEAKAPARRAAAKAPSAKPAAKAPARPPAAKKANESEAPPKPARTPRARKTT